MPRAKSNGIEIEYETFGAIDAEPLLLVMGLGGQMVLWDEGFCRVLADRGFHVIRFDNRDAGRAMEMAAVRVSIDNLRTFPCIQEKERRGTLKLRGAFFAINDGVLYLMDETTGDFSPV